MAPEGKKVRDDIPNHTVYFDPPHAFIGFLLLLMIRLLSAISMNFEDCDEVFNYWEPTHYLLYKKGFQTWEYSPEYGIRSYAFLIPFYIWGKIFGLFIHDKFAIFYLIRVFLSLISVASETYFFTSTAKRYGPEAGFFVFFFQLISAGYFSASTTFLPSSFAMQMTMICVGAWMRDQYTLALFASILAVVVGWPFCALVYVPFALHMLLKKGLWSTITKATYLFVLVAAYVVFVDYHYVKKIMFAPLNIVLYNVFGGADVGPELYGTEPWTYYLYNLIINHNVTFMVALSMPIVILVLETWAFAKKRTMLSLWHTSPMYLWVIFMSFQPHKEERFIYVIYPFISLGASITLSLILHACLITKNGNSYKKFLLNYNVMVFLVTAFIMIAAAIHVSRISATVDNYKAPTKLWQTLKIELKTLPHDKETNVCIGKEWYRFPSNFFLPYPNQNLRFLKSGFDGLLAKEFEEWPKGTYVLPTGMNNRNEENPDRYSDISVCDYLVEQYFQDQVEENYLETLDIGDGPSHAWSMMAFDKFLDRERSMPFARSFLIPEYSKMNSLFSKYYVLKRNRH